MEPWPRVPQPREGPPVLIVGASARAAAEMAAREGWLPWAADRFADWDLSRWCKVHPAHPYPQAMKALLAQAPQGPWLYTGALENRPELVAQLAQLRPLAGVGPEVLARVRNPWWLYQTLHRAGLPVAEVCPPGRLPPRDGKWLLKPLRSAGGFGIWRWNPSCPAPFRSDRHYFQKFLPGLACSGLFLSWEQGCRLIGMSGQWVGRSWAGAEGWIYCGSWGPMALEDELRRQLEHLGKWLTQQAGLQGLWGADGVLTRGKFTPVEINPRITASAELYQLAHRWPLISWHVRCFEGLEKPPIPASPSSHHKLPKESSLLIGKKGQALAGSGFVWAKVVLYARNRCRFPPGLGQQLLEGKRFPSEAVPPGTQVAWRDLPHPHSPLAPRQPVLTLIVKLPGEYAPQLEQTVARLARWLYDLLENPS